MEQLNKIELRGNVGNIRIQAVGDNEVAHFSLATNYAYKGKDGIPVIETTWHNIVAWEGKDIHDMDKIAKGVPVYVCGRLRLNKYTNAEGIEKQVFEVQATKLRIVKEE